MSAKAGYLGDIYIIDDASAFSTAFNNKDTTENGVTRQYTIDDTSIRYLDMNYPITVAGYWAFQEFGLSTTSGASSGLSNSTQYYFKIAKDGGSIVEYSITTVSATTWADIVALINSAITGAGMTCEFINGDVRIHSNTTTLTSDISCTAGTSGTSLFGSGNVPAVANLETIDWSMIGIDTVNFYSHGIKYASGVVQMTHTGFTSLTVSGKYHTLKQAGQFTGYNLTMNCNAVDITALQNQWKANIPTTKNYQLSLDGFYNNSQYFRLNSNGIVLIKLYIDVGYPAYQKFGLSTNSWETSGLSTTTQYYFKISWEGAGATEYSITTGSDVTWGAIVSLINTAISVKGKCTFVNGDVKITSLQNDFTSSVVCSAGTSGTSLFGVGNVPLSGSLITSTPEGFYCYGISGQTLTATPHEVVRESLSFECTGGLERFTS